MTNERYSEHISRGFNNSSPGDLYTLIKEDKLIANEQITGKYQTMLALLIPLFVTSMTIVKELQGGFQKQLPKYHKGTRLCK